jgi:C-terminal processing protease CtpA/Prc
LTDEYTASGAEAATAILKLNDIATVVGEPTRGVFGTTSDMLAAVISLPNTGILVRMDIAFFKDHYGNPLQGYGIQPHYRPRDGMCALETVLAMIGEGN